MKGLYQDIGKKFVNLCGLQEHVYACDHESVIFQLRSICGLKQLLSIRLYARLACFAMAFLLTDIKMMLNERVVAAVALQRAS